MSSAAGPRCVYSAWLGVSLVLTMAQSSLSKAFISSVVSRLGKEHEDGIQPVPPPVSLTSNNVPPTMRLAVCELPFILTHLSISMSSVASACHPSLVPKEG